MISGHGMRAGQAAMVTGLMVIFIAVIFNPPLILYEIFIQCNVEKLIGGDIGLDELPAHTEKYQHSTQC
jgi:hypothetical protein